VHTSPRSLNSKNPSLNNELVQKKIETDIRGRLTERGLTEVPGEPDLNVRYSLGSGARVADEAYPAGWRGTRFVRRRYAEGCRKIPAQKITAKQEYLLKGGLP
jgi:hypothetical protein